MRAPNDPDYGQHDSRKTSEARLVHAILAQAIRDLFGPLLGYGDTALVRRDAMLFLTGTGREGQDREILCSVSGYDAEVMRKNIVSILEGSDASTLTYAGRGGFSCIDDARAMWAARKTKLVSARAKRVSAPHVVDDPTATPAPMPARLPRIVPKFDQAAADRARVYSLLVTPKRQKDIMDALANEMTYNKVLTILNVGIAKGEVVRDAARKYQGSTSNCG